MPNKNIWQSNSSLFLISHKKCGVSTLHKDVNLAWKFQAVPKNCLNYNNYPLQKSRLYGGFSSRVWPWFSRSHEKVSAITMLYNMSDIERLDCSTIYIDKHIIRTRWNYKTTKNKENRSSFLCRLRKIL